MFRRFTSPPADYPPFATLPVRYIRGGHAAHRLAVHVTGRFTVNLPPLICVAGFNRNMTDFADFVRNYRETASLDWPIVLVDLAGRGRSSFLGSPEAYSAVSDAHDLAVVARALGISRAVFVGQGHGGQAIMALAAHHPALIAGAVLINAGPTTNPQGLVRLRSNLQHIKDARGETQIKQVTRRILSVDYPRLPDEVLDALAARTHFIDARGQAHGLFDPSLVKFLDSFEHDDVFEPQWQLFNALAAMPLMLVRSQHSDRLRPDTLDEMISRRPSATVSQIVGEGSPALLNNGDEVGEIADFIMHMGGVRRWTTASRRWRK